ncbi:MAG: HAD family hydrolase [Clostridiales bacterium]|nr:HAD family hydrolase [Clostridiales bacterium]
MKKAVIFDLDGTLLDTIDDLTDSVNFMLRTFGHPERTRDEVKSFVGNGAVKLIERSLPEKVDDEKFSERMAVYKEHYAKNQSNKTVPYDGVVELLRELKDMGVKTAVYSNKHDSAVQTLCEHYFKGLTDAVYGHRRDMPTKPAPDAIFEIGKEFGLEIVDMLYVGDSETDILTGKNAGIDTVAVTWGFRDRETLIKNGAYRFADTAEEIKEIVLDQRNNVK